MNAVKRADNLKQYRKLFCFYNG